MKKTIATILVLSLLLSMLSGCGQILAPAQTLPPTDPAQSSAATEPSQATVPDDNDFVGEDTQAGENIQAGDIRINEVMPDNKKLCLGHENDWIELYNAELTDIYLDGYYLSDDPENLQALSLAGLTIPAEGFLVITLDDSSPFRLSSNGEDVYLSCGSQLLSQLSFGLSDDGESFDANGVCAHPTPGHANTQEGYLAYLQELTLPELIISEVMSSNSRYQVQRGEYYDMVEIKNNSDKPIDLSAYTLSDKKSEPDRYAFPEVILQPGEFYIVYCSGLTSLGLDHASFKLSADGETVYLSKQGVLTDVLTIPSDLLKNESYGRVGNIPMYLDTPTFGYENSNGSVAGLAAPVADIPSGIYEESCTVTLRAEGEIYYTLDGSRPTTASARYLDPIMIDGVTTIRTFCVLNGRSSAEATYTYAVGAEHTIPVLVISIPEDYLNGETGVLNNIDPEYEHEAVVTLIEDGQEKFSVPFGFRLHGNDSRLCPKQNFQLRFRGEYGVSRLNYQLFDGLDISQFNSLVLKGGSEDWHVSMIRDLLCTSVVSGTTNLYTMAWRPVVLYLGGEYWGVYFLQEHFSDEYVASHLNVSEESVDLLNSTWASPQAGSDKDFLALRQFCESNDMSLDENYDYLCSQIDVQSLMDWYICRIYFGDLDTANIRRFRTSEADGLWRWMFFDLDWSFYFMESQHVRWILNSANGDKVLIQALLANENGRDLFLQRFCQLMDTVLNEEYISAAIDEICLTIDAEMEADRAMWNSSYSLWRGEIAELKDFAAARKACVLTGIQDCFALTDAQMEHYFGA